MLYWSIGFKKNGTIVVTTTYGKESVYPDTTHNRTALADYLATLSTYDYRLSDNPEFTEIYGFKGYFHLGDWSVDGYLNFTFDTGVTNMFHAGTTFAFIRAIAIENDTDANELINVLDGLCEIEDYIPRSTPLLAIKSIDLYTDSIDDSRNLEFVTVGYRNLPNYVIIDSNALFTESSVLPLISYEEARALFYDDYRTQHDTERELFEHAKCCRESVFDIWRSCEELYWHMGCIFARLADLYYAAYNNLEITRGTKTTYARSNILLD